MNQTNRKINQLFLWIAEAIYKSDMKNDDTRSWWPIRPVYIDAPLAPFLFAELIHLFKKADEQKISLENLVEIFGSADVILDLQFLWPSLGWRPTTIHYEDRLYLITKLIEITEKAPDDKNYEAIFEKLAKEIKESGNKEKENVLKVATRLYMEFVRKLYEEMKEDWQQALEKATKIVQESQNEISEPRPWAGDSKEKAIRQLVRNSDFRREKEKDMEQVLQGVPEVPGIAEGVVGINIIVTFSLESASNVPDAYITDVDAFKNLPIREELAGKGVVVVSKTRNGTHTLKNGDKVLVDGTSGIIYRVP